MTTQKCSGHACVQRDKCEHYKASKVKDYTRGKWIDAEMCIGGLWSLDGKTILKPPFYNLELKDV